MQLPNSASASDATAHCRADHSMFLTRLATSAVVAPIALVAVYIGFPAFHVLIALMAAAVLWEFTQIVEKSGLNRRIVIALGLAAIAVGVSAQNVGAALAIIALGWAGLFVSDTSGRRLKSSSIQAGFICAAIPSVCLIAVAQIGDATTVFWILAIVWGTDVGAYAVGRTIGGPRLVPVISPNKTWSGAIGGLVTAVLAAALLSNALSFGPNVTNLALAAGLSIFCQVGDLAESHFKRQHDVKDSGTWMPGHGGVMDRLDGLWTVAPVAALLCIVQKGGVDSW